jgi:hypothetical protein
VGRLIWPAGRGLTVAAPADAPRLLALALPVYTLMAGGPGDFPLAIVMMVIGAIFGAIAGIPALVARHRSQRDQH